MKKIILFFVFYAFIKTDNKSKIELKITNNTYNLDMKCNDYKNLVKQNKGLPASKPGFFIGRLDVINNPYSIDSGKISIKIIKDDNEIEEKVICDLLNLTKANEGFNLACKVDKEYDYIILDPKNDDDIIIENIGTITISNSFKKDDNSNFMMNLCGKYELQILALLLLI